MFLFRKQWFLLAALVCLLFSCGQPEAYRTQKNAYAQGFSIEQADDYTKVEVYSPWHDDAVLATYYLVRDMSTKVPSDGIKLQVPVKRLSTTSVTHIGLIAELGQLDKVCGVCNPEMIYCPEFHELSLAGGVSNLGDAMQVNVERVLLTKPDAVMVSTFAQGDVSSEQLMRLGMPVIFNNEWTERTPLARAEWLRFTAAFFDCMPLADSLFAQVESRYQQLKALVDTEVKQKADSGELRLRTVMSGNNFRGTWYVPAGNTYMGVLFKDAGADYYYQSDSSYTSIPLGVEEVVRHFSDADVWFGSNARSLKDLADFDEKHTWFKAYRQAEVYNFYRRRPEGSDANDFWETGVVHPELILSDLVKVLYPNLLPDYELYFVEKLK